MKYALSRDTLGEHAQWTLMPWRLRGLREFDRTADVPADHVLVVSHFAPWWEPLRTWIAQGRSWIEIEYGYWGPDTPRRTTRRVTWCGHHNLNIRARPHSRRALFPAPKHHAWCDQPGDYVLAIQPVEEILMQRTGENLQQFRDRLTKAIRPYWSGEIRWRKKVGAKVSRWPWFVEQCSAAYAVVGERTMACTEACLLGVPGFTLDTSMSTLLTGDISNLASAVRPDRDDWWDHICWSQFQPEEFQTTVPADLVEEYQARELLASKVDSQN